MEMGQELSNQKSDKVSQAIAVLIDLGPENVRHYHRGVTEQNALEFDNKWNNITQKVGYNSNLGNQGMRVLESGNYPGIGRQPLNAQREQAQNQYAESRGLAAPSPSFSTGPRSDPIRITSDANSQGSRYLGGERRL